MLKISAVVVTHNRLALLKECILGLESQIRSLDTIYVVNNDSTDGTAEWLLTKKNLIVLNERNLGGANGFFVGIKKSYDDGNDWTWCLDDDTIVQEDSLSKMLLSNKIERDDTGFICSVVNWTNGDLHKSNYVSPLNKDFNIYKNINEDMSVEVNNATFVSLLLSRKAIRICGLPIKEFFIWLDDFEYTTRISNVLKCYLKVDSVVIHKTIDNETTQWFLMNKQNFFKYKHLIKNHLWLLRKNNKQKTILQNVLQHTKCVYTILKISIKRGLFLKSIKSIYDGYNFNPVIIDKYE